MWYTMAYFFVPLFSTDLRRGGHIGSMQLQTESSASPADTSSVLCGSGREAEKKQLHFNDSF